MKKIKNKKLVEEIEITQKFLEICPDFRKQWEKYLEWWGKDTPGIYTGLGEFSHFIVDSYKRKEIKKFPEIFKQIEFYLKNGDTNIKEVISLGILESIQNIASHEEFGYKPFEKWLGPISKKYWKDIEVMWEGKSSLMDVIRAEKKSK